MLELGLTFIFLCVLFFSTLHIKLSFHQKVMFRVTVKSVQLHRDPQLYAA
jgi:hypothetical protein